MPQGEAGRGGGLPFSLSRTVTASVPRRVYTVSRLNREVRALLEGHFPLLWVEGEISNLARPGSGHLYFSLKDAQAQVRCAMFRLRNRHLDFRPANGMQVLVRARVGLYEPRGEFQLVVEHMEPAGAGALQRAFEALKARLAAEGLFDSRHKRPLPPLPRRVGVITSPTGAALRDVLSVLRRRFPAVPVRLFPVPVQGEGAAEAIAAALDRAGRRRDCDVLLLVRGGGSLEDLWAFNEEVVARAVRRCPVPVVVGVGHEVDFTIADLAADRRAPTPSAAAEMVTPHRDELLERLDGLARRLVLHLRRRLAQEAQRLTWLARRLGDPRRHLHTAAQRLDELERRLTRAQHRRLQAAGERLAHLEHRLRRAEPRARLAALEQAAGQLRRRLAAAMGAALASRRQRLDALERTLRAVSPLGTLERGYAIVRRPDGALVRSAAQVAPGETLETVLADGRLRGRVEAVEETPPWERENDGP